MDGAVGRESHHHPTVAKGSRHGAGPAPQRRDCASGTGAAAETAARNEKEISGGLRFISARADPNNRTDTEPAPARLRPATPKPQPMGEATEAAGAQSGDPREVTNPLHGPRGSAGRSQQREAVAVKHQPLRDGSSCGISPKPPGDTGQSPGDTGVPRRGFKGPRDLK